MSKENLNNGICSFCGKSADMVEKLISGPGANICNECIRLCNEIIYDNEEFHYSEGDVDLGELLKPMQLLFTITIKDLSIFRKQTAM